MTLTERQAVHTLRVGKFIVSAAEEGLSLKVVEWNRLLSTQRDYVARGVSKTLNSKHLDNLAVDIYIVSNGKTVMPVEDESGYRRLGILWESLGGRWGGRFVDRSSFFQKHGREFDPSKDLGWDPVHFESADL